MNASLNGHIDVVMFLVEGSANLNMQDVVSLLRLLTIYYAFWMSNSSLHSSSQRGRTALIQATYSRHLPIVQYLFEHGADVNIKTTVHE